MGINVFANIPITVDLNIVRETIKLRNNSRINRDTEELIRQANGIAKPKALFIESTMQETDGHSVLIDGIAFRNKTLIETLKDQDKVYPYVVTCGIEIDGFSETLNDPMKKFILDGIMMILVNSAKDFLACHIKEKYKYNDLKIYVPGATEEWQKDEQEQLFALVGDETELIGVSLSDTGFVLPRRSNIGIMIRA